MLFQFAGTVLLWTSYKICLSHLIEFDDEQLV